jgi:hypothetical protein
MELGLKGRAAVITGGSRGIGTANAGKLQAGVVGTEGREAFPADFWRRMGIIAGQSANGSQLVIDGGMSANPRPA